MIDQFLHHGIKVWALKGDFGTHRQHCMCYQHCKFFKPNEPDNCEMAQQLFETDVKFGLTTPVYECPKWEDDGVMEPLKVWHVVGQFAKALYDHLQEKDDPRWGDTWLKRTRAGQEERTIHNFRDKFDKYLNAGQPIDWLSIAGDAMICWFREQSPDLWPE